jgi:hypothetical protein
MMAHVEFIGATEQPLGVAWLTEDGAVAFSTNLGFLAQQPVMAVGDKRLMPVDGQRYLHALTRQYSGSYFRARWRDGDPPE